MDADSSFWLIWVLYCAASCGFCWVYWQVTSLPGKTWLRYSLRALMLALIFTPWYANIEGQTLAPALMILTLDAITIGVDAMGRALIPLLFSLLLAELLATAYYFKQRNSKKTVKTES